MLIDRLKKVLTDIFNYDIIVNVKEVFEYVRRKRN